MQSTVDVAFTRDQQIAYGGLEMKRARRPLQPHRLRLAPVDEQAKLRKHSRIAQPQPLAVRARCGHGAVGCRHRKPAVLFEDGALRRQEVRQELRAWTEAGAAREAASKFGREPI